MKYFLGKEASIIVRSDIRMPKKINYTVPFKYIQRAKEEIIRLAYEDIIEKSLSNIVSPAFFIEKRNGDLRLAVITEK